MKNSNATFSLLKTTEQADYTLGISPAEKRVRGYKDKVLIFDSKNALFMQETHHEPVYYIPRTDVNMLLFTRNNYRTFCPFKGNATHWNLSINGTEIENAAWSYETPLEEAKEITGFIAFYENVLDQFFIDKEQQSLAPPQENNDNSYTLVEWLLQGAIGTTDQIELTRRLVDRFLATGIPIMRLNVAIRQLHPLLAGESYLWRKSTDQIETQQIMHESMTSLEYLQSPLKLVIEGLGGIRQKLTADQTEFDFPIMRELRDLGATDYVALPLVFSDGNIHNLTLTSDHPNGFSTAHLGQIFEALPLISSLYEVHKLKSNTQALLQTYLGKSAGEQVLSGLTKRGDGGTIQAAILYCDLANSTGLTETLGQQEYLDLLNDFFEAVSQSVYGNKGDILKFIGDAVLAIFPVTDNNENAIQVACSNAAKTVRDTISAIETSSFRENLSCTAGLHYGKVMYGNIGSEQRLDFTVIGSAANEVARISDLCKKSRQHVMLSKEIADILNEDVASLGEFTLKGFTRPRELFCFSDDQTNGH